MRKITVFLLVFLVAGCDHYSEKMTAYSISAEEMNAYAPAAGIDGGIYADQRTFRDYLAAEYLELARYEHNESYDYKAAARYTTKANMLLEGGLVGPDHPTQFPVGKNYKEDLILAREELIDTLITSSSPQNRAVLAIAQTRYDCWIDQAVEWPNDPQRITCDDQFIEAMASVVHLESFFLEDGAEFFL